MTSEMTTKFESVESSNIDGVHYDPASETLSVKFKNGGTYRYADCSKKHYDGMLTAKSAGSYFHTHIKPHHKHSKVEESK